MTHIIQHCDNLHEDMCRIAESTVHYNWCDVVLYDKERLKYFEEGEYFSWTLGHLGSRIFSLSCARWREIYEGLNFSTSIEEAIRVWLTPKALDSSQSYLKYYSPESMEFYLVQKLSGGSGAIQKVSYFDMVELVMGKEIRDRLNVDPYYEVTQNV